jgi:SAM-dependent methyltransferase
MFWGAQPVFLDVLSFERRDPHDPTWLAYAQFVRSFLLPLLVNQRYRIPLDQIFTTRRDGLEPEEVYPLLGPLERLGPRAFSLITFPVWFGKRAAGRPAIYQPRRLRNAEQARFILASLLRTQQRTLNRLRPQSDRDSKWSGYMTGNNNYADAGFEAKAQFVRQSLAETQPEAVLDLGCNTGVFSLLAAELGARVVAVDSDPVVVGSLWSTVRRKAASVLPLVVNIAQPTPALGWANAECSSFLERATGAFDTVLMLALIHHLLVTDRVPLREIFQTARRLTRKWLIVEYVGPSDSMFQRLVRGREHLHREFNREAFEQAAQSCFRIVRSRDLAPADRRLYLLEAN